MKSFDKQKMNTKLHKQKLIHFLMKRTKPIIIQGSCDEFILSFFLP